MRSVKLWYNGKFRRVEFYLEGEKMGTTVASESLVVFDDGICKTLGGMTREINSGIALAKRHLKAFKWLDQFVWYCPKVYTRDSESITIVNDKTMLGAGIDATAVVTDGNTLKFLEYNGRLYVSLRIEELLNDDGKEALHNVIESCGWVFNES